jgi:N-acetylmuramoyl-L-alanine amidase
MQKWIVCMIAASLFFAGTMGKTQGKTEILPKTDVLIDVGHGGIDGGTFYGEILEKDINLAVAKKTYGLLTARGFHVALNRTGDYALSDENFWFKSFSRHKRDLAQRAHLANELKPQILVSLHVNASKDQRTNGPIVLHQNNPDSILLAHLIQNSLNRLYNTNEKPIYGKKYYLLNHVRCPAVIVEMGFLTNKADRNRLTNPGQQKRIAESISLAAEQYLSMIHPHADATGRVSGLNRITGQVRLQ